MQPYLLPVDLIVAGVILFGPAIVTSLRAPRVGSLSETENPETQEPEEYRFTVKENLWAIVSQLVQLGLAMGYLCLRGYDPLGFRFSITPETVLASIALFCFLGFGMDFITSMKDGFGWIPKLLRNNIPLVSAAEGMEPSLIAYSLLNGFYEEFFFLGLCTAVAPQYALPAFAFSLIVRVAIHIYQGWFTALSMSLFLGISYFLLYTHVSDNLFLYAMSHGLADLFGLSLFNIL